MTSRIKYEYGSSDNGLAIFEDLDGNYWIECTAVPLPEFLENRANGKMIQYDNKVLKSITVDEYFELTEETRAHDYELTDDWSDYDADPEPEDEEADGKPTGK